MRIRFTADLIRSLVFERRPVAIGSDGTLVYDQQPLPPGVRDWTLRDSQILGFGIRLTKGSKTYFVQRKRGSSTSDRYVLTDQHSLKAARRQAQEWLVRMARGEDPRQDRANTNAARFVAKARAELTFAKVFAAYMTGGVGLRPRTVSDRAMASRWMAKESLWNVPLFTLGKSDVHQVFGPMMTAAEAARTARKAAPGMPRKRGGGPHSDVASAWKAFRHCAAAWTASEADKPLQNPFLAWRREHRKTLPKVERRETSLPTRKDAGIAWLKKLLELREAPEHVISVVADYLTCVLLWGARRESVQVLRWGDVLEEEGAVLFRADTSKTRRNLWLPLTPWAASILRERRARSQAEGLKTEPADWVFHSVKPGKHIVEIREVQKLLKEASGLWIGPHDLRRTLAGDVFGDTLDVRTVGMVLGHAKSDGDVSASYVPDKERLRALRPVYEARERELRRLTGVEVTNDPLSGLSSEQRAILVAAEAMLRSAGITPDVAAATLGGVH